MARAREMIKRDRDDLHHMVTAKDGSRLMSWASSGSFVATHLNKKHNFFLPTRPSNLNRTPQTQLSRTTGFGEDFTHNPPPAPKPSTLNPRQQNESRQFSRREWSKAPDPWHLGVSFSKREREKERARVCARYI